MGGLSKYVSKRFLRDERVSVEREFYLKVGTARIMIAVETVESGKKAHAMKEKTVMTYT